MPSEVEIAGDLVCDVGSVAVAICFLIKNGYGFRVKAGGRSLTLFGGLSQLFDGVTPCSQGWRMRCRRFCWPVGPALIRRW